MSGDLSFDRLLNDWLFAHWKDHFLQHGRYWHCRCAVGYFIWTDGRDITSIASGSDKAPDTLDMKVGDPNFHLDLLKERLLACHRRFGKCTIETNESGPSSTNS